MFKGIDDVVSQIPEVDRYNVHYTIANCLPPNEAEGIPLRYFHHQEVIVFDIDHCDEKQIKKYHRVICNAIKVDISKTALVWSGHGLHLIIALSQSLHINSLEELNKLKPYYIALCGEINQALFINGMVGNADPVIFSQSKTIRLPNTLNRKEGKQDVMSYIVQNTLEPQAYDITKVVTIESTEQEKEQAYTVDPEGVLQGCKFLSHARENADRLSEPEWFAMIGVLALIPDIGKNLCHSYSKPYPNYDQTQTDAYIDRAIALGKPRICDGIDSIWGRCRECPHYKKVKTPLQLQGTSFIKTEKTGFHQVFLKNGIPYKQIPIYEDIVRYYEKKNTYVVHSETGVVHTFTGKYWEEKGKLELEGFATENFKPTANNSMRAEFMGLLRSKNLVQDSFFSIKEQGYVNFNNGILRLRDKVLLPHSVEFGFKYCLPYDYNPYATAPRFDKFMDEITMNDKELRQLLLEFMAYAISGLPSRWGQKALVLTGKGKNGKSVFLETMQKLVGKDCFSAVSMGNLSNPVSRYNLISKLFNVCEETPNKSLADSSDFKSIVSGGTLEVKKLYHQPTHASINCKLIFACNELPANYDYSDGVFRRLLIVPFKASFYNEKDDKGIYEELWKELPGIYNIILGAYDGLVARGEFIKSSIVENKIKEYREEDHVFQFMDERLIEDPNGAITTSELYQTYEYWSKLNGAIPMSMNHLSRRLKHLIKEEQFTRLRRGETQVRGITGYRLLRDGGSNF
jgi:putative DNA primase/helicase